MMYLQISSFVPIHNNNNYSLYLQAFHHITAFSHFTICHTHITLHAQYLTLLCDRAFQYLLMYSAGALDSVSGRQIMELFSELNQEGMTVLMITHDAQIAGCADRMVMIKDGRLKDGEEQENGKE